MGRLGGHHAKYNKSEEDKYCILYKNYSKLVNITKEADLRNKLVVTTLKRKAGGTEKQMVIMGLYEVICVKLKNCKVL